MGGKISEGGVKRFGYDGTKQRTYPHWFQQGKKIKMGTAKHRKKTKVMRKKVGRRKNQKMDRQNLKDHPNRKKEDLRQAKGKEGQPNGGVGGRLFFANAMSEKASGISCLVP